MRLTIDVGTIKEFTQRGGSEQGFPEPRRVKTVRVVKPIRTDRGHGKMVVTCYVAIYDRKKPWKAGKYPTMKELRAKAAINRAFREAAFNASQSAPAVN
jgi:hypothetical protein